MSTTVKKPPDYVSRKIPLDKILYCQSIVSYETVEHKSKNLQTKYGNIPQESINNTIQDVVERAHIIMFHLSHFLKLYLCHLDSLNEIFPIINEKFLHNMMYAITYVDDAAKSHLVEENLTVVNKLSVFYEDHYKCFLSGKISRSGIFAVLDSQIEQYVTNLSNNIHAHYWMRLKQCLNLEFKISEKREKINLQYTDVNKRRELKTKLTIQTNTIQDSLLKNNFNINDKEIKEAFDIDETKMRALSDKFKIPIFSEFMARDIEEKKYLYNLKKERKERPKYVIKQEEKIENLENKINKKANEPLKKKTPKGRENEYLRKEEELIELRIKLEDEKEKLELLEEKAGLNVVKDLVIKDDIYNYKWQFDNNPTLYLQSFFRLNNYLSFDNDEKGKFHTVPLCTSAIPPYVTLTTSSLLEIFGKTDGDINDKVDYIIWRKYFHLFKGDTIDSKMDWC